MFEDRLPSSYIPSSTAAPLSFVVEVAAEGGGDSLTAVVRGRGLAVASGWREGGMPETKKVLGTPRLRG